MNLPPDTNAYMSFYVKIIETMIFIISPSINFIAFILIMSSFIHLKLPEILNFTHNRHERISLRVRVNLTSVIFPSAHCSFLHSVFPSLHAQHTQKFLSL